MLCRWLVLCSCFIATSSFLTKHCRETSNLHKNVYQLSRWCSKPHHHHPSPLLFLLHQNGIAKLDDDDDSDRHDDDNDKVERDHHLLDLDQRPHEQRAKSPRTARRLNHAFKYLYRHHDNNTDNSHVSNDCIITSREFLHRYGGFTHDEIDEMSRNFPPLLDINVQRHLRPKLRFLQETILGNGQVVNNNQQPPLVLPEIVRRHIPPQYFGARLERTLAPRYAFLVYMNLPHGRQLLSTKIMDNAPSTTTITTMWQDFLLSCRHPKRFAALCNRWRQQQQQRQQRYKLQHDNHRYGDNDNNNILITSKQIEAFDAIFSRGLMSAARNEIYSSNNHWPLAYINMTSSELISLLIQHGANPLERDIRGVSLLHWAAGTGNLAAVQVLWPYFPTGVYTKAERDGAFPLHWAAAGAKTREFGCGGHTDVCQFLLEQQNLHSSFSTTTTTSSSVSNRGSGHVDDDLNSDGHDAPKTLLFVNAVTKDGNSALMWAAWSGTLETVKLLIRNRADASISNRNGCTVAHWAASGGNVAVCQYLADICQVDFSQPNHGGNTPLTHAVAFGRVQVVEWLLRQRQHDDKQKSDDISSLSDPDLIAVNLAQEFVTWTGGEEKRQQVLNLMSDWLGVENDDDDNSNVVVNARIQNHPITKMEIV